MPAFPVQEHLSGGLVYIGARKALVVLSADKRLLPVMPDLRFCVFFRPKYSMQRINRLFYNMKYIFYIILYK